MKKIIKILVPSILMLLSISFLLPINLWFHMGTCIGLVIFYNILSGISYFIKRKVKK